MEEAAPRSPGMSTQANSRRPGRLDYRQGMITKKAAAENVRTATVQIASPRQSTSGPTPELRIDIAIPLASRFLQA